MSTRATQIELFLDPLIDPTAGCLCSGYTAYFYAAGTSTEKNIWTEKEKTNPFTTYDLDSAGKALLYGDGIYKIVVKNPDGTTVLSVDNQKIQATTFSVVQKTSAYTATPDDDVILANGTFTVSLEDVSDFDHPVVVKNIGTGTITVDPDGAQTIDGSATVAITNQYDAVTLYPDTTSNVWRRSGDLQADLNGTELILDADGDTTIAADTDDQVDLKVGGTDRLQVTNTSFIVKPAGTARLTVTDTAVTVAATMTTGVVDINGSELIIDADADTSITADTDDQIDVKIGGSDKYQFTATSFNADAIGEKTAAAGVTIDSLQIKDGKLVTVDSVINANITNVAVTLPKITNELIRIASWYYPGGIVATTSDSFVEILMYGFICPASPAYIAGEIRHEGPGATEESEARIRIELASDDSTILTGATVTRQSVAWDAFADLDVSSLTPGTKYRLILEMKNETNASNSTLHGCSFWWKS